MLESDKAGVQIQALQSINSTSKSQFLQPYERNSEN